MVGTAPEEPSASDRAGKQSRISTGTKEVRALWVKGGMVALLLCQWSCTFSQDTSIPTRDRSRSSRVLEATTRIRAVGGWEERQGASDI